MRVIATFILAALLAGCGANIEQRADPIDGHKLFDDIANRAGNDG